MTAERSVSSIPEEQADYALRLFEKGYSVGELARLIGVDRITMTKAIDEAVERRGES